MDIMKEINGKIIREQKLKFAKLKLYSYPEGFFICLSDLLDDKVFELMEWVYHGLDRDCLCALLCDLFESAKLVAWHPDTGFFSPGEDQIKHSLYGLSSENGKNVFSYGVTNIGMSEYKKLVDEFERLYGVVA